MDKGIVEASIDAVSVLALFCQVRRGQCTQHFPVGSLYVLGHTKNDLAVIDVGAERNFLGRHLLAVSTVCLDESVAGTYVAVIRWTGGRLVSGAFSRTSRCVTCLI